MSCEKQARALIWLPGPRCAPSGVWQNKCLRCCLGELGVSWNLEYNLSIGFGFNFWKTQVSWKMVQKHAIYLWSYWLHFKCMFFNWVVFAETSPKYGRPTGCLINCQLLGTNLHMVWQFCSPLFSMFSYSLALSFTLLLSDYTMC